MLAVAIVSGAVSGTVAVATIMAQLWQQQKSLKHNRKLSDLDSVRDVMAEASAVLHRMEYALDDALSTLRAWGAAFFGDREREGRVDLLAYIWPDQSDRIERVRAALEIATSERRIGVECESAAAWVERMLREPAPGRVTLLFHSIVEQYLSEK